MIRLKNAANASLLLAVGFGVGVYASYIDRLVHVQNGFTDGRQSVLNSTVIVGDKPSNCAVEIRLSTLADMVNIGIIDWYKLCTEGQPNEQ